MKPTPNSASALAIFVWSLIGLAVGWGLHASLPTSTEDLRANQPTANEMANMDLYWEVWDLIDEEYYEADISSEERVYGAIYGMVGAVGDPYSYFMDPEDTKESNISLNGDLEGIGAELTMKNGLVTIVAPIKNTPAEEAGLQPEDIITQVDGEDVTELTLMEVIHLIRGEPGTDVTLSLFRPGGQEPFDVTITRAEIEVPSLELEFETVNNKKIAHLNLLQFSNDTDQIFRAALRDVIVNEADGLVLDMRLNPGGYLDVAVNIVGEFFEDEKRAVIVKSRTEGDNSLYTSGGGSLPDLPVVVLIDEGSASASEIVAGALQDYDRAQIVGEQSFGKGSVQDLIPLRAGSSLRLTVAKWYTPNDRTISEVGISPDIEVEMEFDAIGTENDVQYQTALDLLSR